MSRVKSPPSMKCLSVAFVFLVLSIQSAFSFEPSDRSEIEQIIRTYTESWNNHEGAGFAENYTEDADFVNIFGMHFKSRIEIGQRHVEILKGFLKGSKLNIANIELREAKSGVVIAHVRWKLVGYRTPSLAYNRYSYPYEKR